MPDPDLLLSWAKLETLPYLSAVIKEALRSAGGFSSRIVRVPQNAPLRYKSFVLPPGTAIGMSQKLLSRHPDLFDAPDEFNPERWLTKNGPSDLYSFGRGPRMYVHSFLEAPAFMTRSNWRILTIMSRCVAQNLAYAELYLALAAIVRWFDLQLFQTDYSDIEYTYDLPHFLPSELPHRLHTRASTNTNLNRHRRLRCILSDATL
jgi:cytochrome P450